jgi:cephalosporin-C deacetylase
VPEAPYAADAASPTLYDHHPAVAALTSTQHDEPDDFDAFWADTLEEARGFPPEVRRTPVDSGLRLVAIEDVTFPGWGGQAVRGWLIRPAAADRPLPLVVQYCGYGGGRGAALDHLVWANAGFAHLVMDTRGQGADTPDDHRSGVGTDGAHVLRGITAPATYYYRRLITDAVRAVECMRLEPFVDASRIVVTGASQGGGLALAAAALAPQVALLLCDIPFLCHWARALQVADRGPYADVNRYCAEHPERAGAALATLRYFDALSFAARANVPASFSVALRDRVCPPSTVLSAFHAYAGDDKELAVHPHNGHEGGGAHQLRLHLTRASQLLVHPGRPRPHATNAPRHRGSPT